MPETCICIGIGSDLRADDGIGLWVARRLAVCNPPGMTIVVATGEGAALIDSWQGAEMVILVDAVSSGAAPGTIHYYAIHDEPLPAQLRTFSTHAFGVAEAVELGRALRLLPDQLIFYGIEGADFSFGSSISAVVEQAGQQVVDHIMKQLQPAETKSDG